MMVIFWLFVLGLVVTLVNLAMLCASRRDRIKRNKEESPNNK